MDLVSKKQFADLCGLATNRLSVEIKRGKVSMTGDKIDLDIEQNANFVKKYQEKKIPHVPTSETKEQIEQEVNQQFADLANFVGLKSIDNIKKVEETKRIIVDTRLKLIQEQTKKGENIPTVLVKNIITQLAKSFTSKFHTACDNFLMEISKRKDLSRSEVAEMRAALIVVVNDGINSAVDECKHEVKNLMRDTSMKKGVGEHG